MIYQDPALSHQSSTRNASIAAIEQEIATNGSLRAMMPFALLQDSELRELEFQTCAKMLTEAAHDKKRAISGIASVEEISRSGLLIDVEGIDLKQFKKNPVVLASHYSIGRDLMPGAIGSVGFVAKRDNALIFKNMVFDTDPLADAWFQKIQRGFVRMVSIGIMPIEMSIEEKEVGKGKNKTTVRFLHIQKSELLEISPTVIGANHGAFIDPGTIPPAPEAEAMQMRIDELRKDVENLKRVLHESDEESESFGDASFPDAAFLVEKGAPKDDGKTPQRFRHLPHHKSSVNGPTENSSIDVPHLRNALARVNQVKPIGENADGFRTRAERHLKAHAKAVLKAGKEAIGALAEYEEADDTADRLVGLATGFNLKSKE